MWKGDELVFSIAFSGVEFFVLNIGSLFKFNANGCFFGQVICFSRLAEKLVPKI